MGFIQLSKKIRESKSKYWIFSEGANVILNDLEGLIKNKLWVTYNNNSVNQPQEKLG